jgi:gas vesicle protein
MNDCKRGGGSFAVGVVMGIILGAGAAFLLAPQTGEEMRDLLRSRVREAGEQAGDLYEKGKVVLENAHGTMKACGNEDELDQHTCRT